MNDAIRTRYGVEAVFSVEMQPPDIQSIQTNKAETRKKARKKRNLERKKKTLTSLKLL